MKLNRIRFRYACGRELRYLSHLDLLRLFQRAMRRAGLPLAYTGGYSPRPRLSLAAPLPVGATASREYGEVYLTKPLTAAAFCRRLDVQLPPGITLTGAVPVPLEEPPLAAVVNAALYRADWAGNGPVPARAALQESLERLLAEPEIMIRRYGKKGRITAQNIRPFIFSVELLPPGDTALSLRLLLQVGSRGGVSPSRVLNELQPEGTFRDEQRWDLHRRGLYIYRDILIDPFPEGGEKVDGQKNNCQL